VQLRRLEQGRTAQLGRSVEQVVAGRIAVQHAEPVRRAVRARLLQAAVKHLGGDRGVHFGRRRG